jgi:NADPH-dependent curcumin reductase CurA
MQIQQVRLRQLPSGVPQLADFELVHAELPAPRAGEVLVRADWLSLDPYVRSLMSGRHFLRQPQSGDVVPARAVCTVLESNHAEFRVGERLAMENGLQSHSVSRAEGAWRLRAEHEPPSTALGILGMPGMTAYFGLLDVAKIRAGETVLVSAASGPVGSMVGQIARLLGARTIGIAGSAAKCDWAIKQARFDACIDYKREDCSERLRELAPQGVDIYFDNAGGEILNTVVMGRHLAMRGRVILCGLISQYSLRDAPPGPNLGPLMACRGSILPMIVYDYEERREEFFATALPWYRADKLAYVEDVAMGLSQAPAQFCKLMRGENFGKTLIRVASS